MGMDTIVWLVIVWIIWDVQISDGQIIRALLYQLSLWNVTKFEMIENVDFSIE